MRSRSICLLIALVACPIAAPESAAQTELRSAASDIAPLAEFLLRGTSLESQGHWQKAADLYERGLRLYPQQADLQDRWRKAERRYSLSRRYHDSSFRSELLVLSENDALNLYREVLKKIQTHFVTDITIDELVRLGYRNVRIALEEDVFLRFNTEPEANAPKVQWLLSQLAKGPTSRMETVSQAAQEARRVGRLCTQNGFQRSVGIILEFVTAACEELDPYSAHLSPSRLKDLYALIDGNFVGLGIEVRGADEGLEIVSVLPSSPAADKGLKRGDCILAVNSERISNMPPEEAANLLQGVEGSTVTLRLKHKAGATEDVEIVRREVIVHSVSNAEIIDAVRGVGYLRLTSFQKLTVVELESAINRLLREGLKSLILDLRGNPGGLLDVAVQTANHFIDDGVIVSTKGRAWGQSWSHRAKPMSAWSFPIIVLVDYESASASEILAGAIKDHRRGLIVGTRTYGKGSVQSIFPLQSVNTALRLTTARFYTPGGQPYEGVGVQPDVVVARPMVALGEEAPVPDSPDLASDRQLAEAFRQITSSSTANLATQASAR